MTTAELIEVGYTFTVRHHKFETEVLIGCNGEFVDSCWAAYRSDAMEAARQRACVDLVEHRLET